MKGKAELVPRSLSVTAIESSPEIQGWLSQFPYEKQMAAQMLLSRLVFISRDIYSEWLRKEILDLQKGNIYALYAVRKLENHNSDFWETDGSVISRSGKALGSEDLVYSLISNVVRAYPSTLLNHPSLEELRNAKVHNYVLIDDSIGSGERVYDFINSMLNNKTFLSWWSFGFVKFHVLSYARQRESELSIALHIKGSDSNFRKMPKTSKVFFTSNAVYSSKWYSSRWGSNYKDIIELCDNEIRVPAFCSLGYGRVMANVIFHHSVPDNTPGVIWYHDKQWSSLFPGRALPDWLLALLNANECETPDSVPTLTVSKNILQILLLIKRGVRSVATIALRMNCDLKFAASLLARSRELDLISDTNRLKKSGFDLIMRLNASNDLPKWNYELYIPKSWCAGQATAQPPASCELDSTLLADSVKA